MLYSRGESYAENRLYSDPGDWPGLAEAHRREFLARTDRGVFSRQAEAILNQSRGFRALPGTAVAIQAGERQVVVTVQYGDEREHIAYDLVVVATGFQARWFEALLGEQARRRLAEALAGASSSSGSRWTCRSRACPAAASAGAGRLAQGPGFPNLSCLGLLSDRILRRYVALDAALSTGEQGPGEERTCLAARRGVGERHRVRRTVVLRAVLAERLAARAEQRGLSFSDLLVEYAQEGLGHDEADYCPGKRGPGSPPHPGHLEPGKRARAAAIRGEHSADASPVSRPGSISLSAKWA